MKKYASNVVAQAKKWLGRNEADGTHKTIIDIYNTQKPLPRGYKVQYDDWWCATTVSAVAVKLGYTDIIPTECSCTKMIEKFKAIGIWEERDDYKPKPGDIIFYDWEDDGKGDNKGQPNHVGIVEKVQGVIITVIEGNKNKAVERRKIAVNGKYIRGYGVPKYDQESQETTPEVKTPEAGDAVQLTKDKLYVSSTGNVGVTRTGTFYLYDGVKVNGRYRVTNKKSRVGKKPLAVYVSGWIKL